MRDYPAMIATVNQVEPVPRRIRGYLAGEAIIDTVRALYVWEWANYPQYYIPLADVRSDALVHASHLQQTRRGPVHVHDLQVGSVLRRGAARVLTESSIQALNNTVRFDWAGLDSWFEEDEQVFVHPRNPYVRVDAIRSSRRVLIELDGIVLAESSSPVMVYETGSPTRYYLPRTCLNLEHLLLSGTVTQCPYKGTTSGYWSVKVGNAIHEDLAWAYDFPTRELLPIAGLVAFYNERVDVYLDGVLLERPKTHFFA